MNDKMVHAADEHNVNTWSCLPVYKASHAFDVVRAVMERHFRSRIVSGRTQLSDREGSTTGCTQQRATRAGFTEPEALTDVDVSPPPPGALAALLSRLTSLLQRASGDPFYAVVAYRSYRRLPE
jgi:hypothetical protein